MKNGGGSSTTMATARQPRARAPRKHVAALAKKGTIPPPVIGMSGDLITAATPARSTILTHTPVLANHSGIGAYALDPGTLYAGGGPVPIMARGSAPLLQSIHHHHHHPPHQITAATYLSILPPQLLHPHPQGAGPPPHAIAVTTSGLSVYPSITSTSARIKGAKGSAGAPPLILPSTVARK